MGLIFFPMFLLFGLHGMPLRKAGAFCLTIAILAAFLGIGLVEGAPASDAIRTDAIIFIGVLGLSLMIFAVGATVRRLAQRRQP
ncbi:MAG: hypothetical protein HOQ25_12970 [Mesorhizobium sp.]|nr:hypothetical protein [Mesorhizobium sp.]